MTVRYGLDLRSGLQRPHNLAGRISPTALIRPGPPFYGPDPSSTHRHLDCSSSTATVRTLRTVYFASWVTLDTRAPGRVDSRVFHLSTAGERPVERAIRHYRYRELL